MVLAVQESTDAHGLETVLTLLVIVSADASSSGVNAIPLKMKDTHFWQRQRIPYYRNMGWFPARKIAAGTQVVALEKAPAAN
jgi:hypothetical protein